MKDDNEGFCTNETSGWVEKTGLIEGTKDYMEYGAK